MSLLFYHIVYITTKHLIRGVCVPKYDLKKNLTPYFCTLGRLLSLEGVYSLHRLEVFVGEWPHGG